MESLTDAYRHEGRILLLYMTYTAVHIHIYLIVISMIGVCSFARAPLGKALSRSLPFTKTSAGLPGTLSARRLMSAQAAGGSTVPDADVFYALGVSVAHKSAGGLKSLMNEDELKLFAKGFEDSILSKVNNDEDIFKDFESKVTRIFSERAGRAVAEEKRRGENFVLGYLLRNPRAVKTKTGLIYDSKLEGLGAQPTAKSTVKVHYHGTLVDGTVFDSSVLRKEPIDLSLSSVIPAWTEGVSMMREGGKATLVCPANIAYGDGGSPPVIPPGATLVFEIELISVKN
jgi:FKBP-type peptidyl-prolyl cis-trans isomerase FkpA/FKBP-type peptidyl-prolyl cis-trans isomerase FklB